MDDRAEIVATGSRWAKSASIVIDAPAQRIFDVLADPDMHVALDGSGTVKEKLTGPERLFLGAHFGMGMRIRLPYRTDNTVVEFEEGRRIAWCHFYKHRWRYELEAVSESSTRVTETFDGRTAIFPPGLLAIRAYDHNQVAVAKTLVRLKSFVEHGTVRRADVPS